MWRMAGAAAAAICMAFAASCEAAPERVPVGRIGPAIDAQIAEFGDFSGAVLVAAHGRVVFLKASGLADREGGTPNTPETQFGVASMGKMFTAVAVAQLSQAGKLDLDAPSAPI